ncbi:MAG: hypothetical protein EOO39_22295 [Cytophagaceae bacterium]|nr:MAG: hypothetical protein EOO39_22295 [Cytophagaceae bacterium]
MTTLPYDWLTQNRIDTEYKQYVVLAYLQSVERRFADCQLHPDLPELKRHYEATLHFRRGKGTLMAAFPKRVAGISGPPPRIDYKSELPADPLLDDVDEIVDFALPRFNATLTEGQQRWDDLAATLTLEPVGLMPLRPEEGYLFVHYTTSSDLAIYQYRFTLYDDQVPGGRMVHWQLRERTQRTIGTTFERLKLDLIRRYNLPNPAAFRLESKRLMPEQETLLPIAQQLLNKAIC